ncbi:hypothetical protein GQ55_8G041500 [Panicum hallii var. hallii]|uniref:Uncharacterized protein n=1 Tax=Panicum hallii var. hallii TaxID=1504633 RepID=A0A2T7CKK1_9POAL|nr:hypothetical protein GQ55_8G041500 [Panicum hallii var. hallii]
MHSAAPPIFPRAHAQNPRAHALPPLSPRPAVCLPLSSDSRTVQVVSAPAHRHLRHLDQACSLLPRDVS